MLLVPRSMILVSAPVRRSRWKRSDRLWRCTNTCTARRRAASCPTLLEHGVAQIVEQHAAEARAGIGDHQRDGEAHARLQPRRHPVHGRLVGEGHEQGDGLGRQHQQRGPRRRAPSIPARPPARDRGGSGGARRSRRAGADRWKRRKAASRPKIGHPPPLASRARWNGPVDETFAFRVLWTGIGRDRGQHGDGSHLVHHGDHGPRRYRGRLPRGARGERPLSHRPRPATPPSPTCWAATPISISPSFRPSARRESADSARRKLAALPHG